MLCSLKHNLIALFLPKERNVQCTVTEACSHLYCVFLSSQEFIEVCGKTSCFTEVYVHIDTAVLIILIVYSQSFIWSKKSIDIKIM